MRANRIKAIVGSLAGLGILIGPGIAQKSALAETPDEVAAMDQGTYLIQPSETHPGFMLPPLSDHLNVAKLSDDEAALEQDDATAQGYAPDYYADVVYPDVVQIVEFVLIPTANEASEANGVGDDGTARQYDRGYYQEPEVVVAMIIVPGENSGEDTEE